MPSTITQTDTTREYRISAGWRAFIYIAAVPMFAAGVFLAVIPFFDGTLGTPSAFVFIPMGLGLALMMLYCLLETVYGKIIIGQGSITQISVLGNKQLLVSEIKGYEVDDLYLRVRPLEKQKPTIKVAVTGLKTDEILQWLNGRKNNLERIDNLEEVALKQEIEDLLVNHDLGATAEERKTNAASGHKMATWLNRAGYAISTWLLLYPVYYWAAISVGILYPLVLIGVMFSYKGVFRLNTRKISAYPSLTPGLLAAGIGIALRALLDVELLHFTSILPWVAAVTGLTFALLLSTTNEFKFSKLKDVGIAAFIFLLLLFYGYGVSVQANALLDNSAPERFETQVTGKHISNGKSTTYYLTLAPWGPRKEPEDITVTQNYYEQIQVGDSTSVLLYSGALDVPYLLVE